MSMAAAMANSGWITGGSCTAYPSQAAIMPPNISWPSWPRLNRPERSAAPAAVRRPAANLPFLRPTWGIPPVGAFQQGAAGHENPQLLLGGFPGVHLARDLTAEEHRNTIAERHDLIQLDRYQQHGRALAAGLQQRLKA